MTWVERQHGASFNPEKLCDYTGQSLFKHPIWDGLVWRMAYWRADGYLKRVRECLPPELGWIAANPEKVQASQTRLGAWLEGIKSNS